MRDYQQEAERIYEERQEAEKQEAINEIIRELKMKEQPPSEAQMKAIMLIEHYLSVTFDGETKHDASQFIGEYIEESKHMQYEQEFDAASGYDWPW